MDKIKVSGPTVDFFKYIDNKESTLEDGRVKIVFKRKLNANNTTDFTQNSCSGGKCSH
jgi:hypothetical protein